MAIITDKSGDKSSKRTIAITFAINAILVGLFLTIYGAFKQIQTPTVVLTVFIGFLSSSLIALGFTLPEWFSKLGGK